MSHRYIKVAYLRLSAMLLVGSSITGCGTDDSLELTQAIGSKFLPPAVTRLPGFPTLDSSLFIQKHGDTYGALKNIHYYSLSDTKGYEDVVELDNLKFSAPDFSWKVYSGLNLNATESLVDRRLYYKGVPLFGVQTKQVVDTSETTTWATGLAPAWLKHLTSDANFNVTEFTLSSSQAAEKASQTLNYHAWRFLDAKKVYLTTLKGLRATYQYTVSGDPAREGRGPFVSLRVLVDADTAEVIDEQPLVFHMDGMARIYKENNVASEELTVTTLPALKAPGTNLASDLHFNVLNCELQEPSHSCQYLAQGSQGNFQTIPFDSASYDEVVAYYAIAKAIQWNKNMLASSYQASNYAGHSWGSSRNGLGLNATNILRVYTRALTRINTTTTLSNAQYMPGGPDDSGMPAIIIGTGWEQSGGASKENTGLKYIGRDADVSMHEFGHHVVYRSLTSTQGESGGMHEGFADFFTYAITGNNKLAESITLSGMPLRQGDIKGSVKSYANTAPHRMGEFWSSVLWEIRSVLGKSQDGSWKADRIIWDSIDYLKERSGFYEAIAAIAKATDIYANATGDDSVALKEQIFSVFYNREFISAPSGNGELPPATANIAKSSLTDGGGSSSSSKSRSKGGGFCGVVASKSSETSMSIAITLLSGLFIPLFFRRRKRGN